jgi:hypothetical protein
MKKKYIIGGIIIILVLSSIPAVNAGEGKPGLIVASMSFSPYGDSGTAIIAAATIKNIGDADIQGTLTLKYTFTRLVFRTIAYIDTTWMSGGLAPGEEAYWPLIYEKELPKFGFFEFKCTVNPGKTIEESNYDNNDLAQKYVAFLGQWKEIG